MILSEFRLKQKLTQKEMSKLAGVCRSTYSNVESGKRKGNALFWLKLQKEFSLSVEEVLELQEKTYSKNG